ncbi:hypothetical protein [Microvirga brassicacearum]|uniref:Uncharacterized protein n=1 Tax=Microvirga brassicacearum TaxID=2580413 RepID=A0A5N3PD93_9HYPH|nr:hypothetical protein [Microvirga brassicacearum]KAB0267674.1 hypothetical protein FEZ63_10365 [Microvirga brassicacearum]
MIDMLGPPIASFTTAKLVAIRLFASIQRIRIVVSSLIHRGRVRRLSTGKPLGFVAVPADALRAGMAKAELPENVVNS